MSEEIVINYAEDILVKVRNNAKLTVELTQQGPQGPQGLTGTLTPELIGARDTAVAAKNAAQDAQAAAETAKGLAQGYSTAASGSASTADAQRALAQTARTGAETARTGAETARTGAETAKGLADTAKTGAETAKTASETARDKAKDWAEKATDTTVETGAYSAKHHATKAAASATNASAQRGLAETAKTGADTANAKAQKWADEAEDTAVEAGKFSAKHHANKAGASASAADASKVAAAQSYTDVTAAVLALGLPSSHVASNFLRRNAGNTAFEYLTAAQVLSAIGAQGALSSVTQTDAEAGTSTTSRNWTPLRVRQAVAAYAATKTHTHEIAEINGLVALLETLATEASPNLTGNPTAPTQNATDDSTRLATTAFVKMVVSDMIGGAPGALDTLQELAAALGDDPNFAATITQQLAGKAALAHLHEMADVNGLAAALGLLAPKASPTFTGTPVAPTQAAGNNTTRIATTAFVMGEIGTLSAAKANIVHAHVIADVTGLQDILNTIQTPMRPALPAGTNLNTVLTEGTYYFDIAANVTTALQFPSASRTGRLQVDKNYGGDHVFQTYRDDSANNQWMRYSTNSGSTWSSWVSFINSSTWSATSQAGAEAGTSTTTSTWTSQRVRQNVVAYAAPIVHVHAIADVTGLEAALALLQTNIDGKVAKGTISGGSEAIITTATATIAADRNGLVLICNRADPTTWTMAAPGTLGTGFMVFITNTGLGDLTITGTFDNGETSVKLEKGQSMALTSNGSAHRLLLRGGGAGGSGSVIPLRQTIQGNGGAVYTLLNTPANQDALLVFVGGVVQSKANFSLNGNQITLGGNVAVDEKIEVMLLKGGASAVGVAPSWAIHAGTGTAGPFKLKTTPPSAECLLIVVGGVVQPKDGTAYTLNGDMITFSENIKVGVKWEETILQPVGINQPNPGSVGALEIKDADVAAIRTKLKIQMDGMPVGTVIFSHNGTVFPGFLALEGGTFAQATYPSLYAYLGSTTLPDYRDRVLRHAGTLAGAVGTLQEDALQTFIVQYGGRGSANGVAMSGSSVGDNYKVPWGPSAAGYSNHDLFSVRTAADAAAPRMATETRVKAAVGKFLIKAFSAFVDEGAINMSSLATEVLGKVNKADIVGTLVQGNGKIIERGSNANGEYVKFADGTMICTGLVAERSVPIVNPHGSCYYSPWYSVNFPATFAAKPTVSMASDFSYSGLAWHTVNFNTDGKTSFRYLLQHATSMTNNFSDRWAAIGRWF